ncbi:type II toxin-antitoxin system PemK/MazF family toxin [Sphingomonas silueang]|uniref:type II toxin-antitoxin system PemK/MazF family toxin n=1 Tax=Sphingomonas silueang TaxID=3156617 RepID=UPI0032B52371
MKPGYVPDTGAIIWLYFDPQAGHEQSGHRPALVLSPARCSGPRGMTICCSMTSRIKRYPFEAIDEDDPPSVVFADQVQNVDWRPAG